MDILVIIDSSENLSPSDFRKLNKWLGGIFMDMREAFDSGSAWINVVLAGSDSIGCNRQNSNANTQVG